jgi:N,N'-diacetyllegionaminate synthase
MKTTDEHVFIIAEAGVNHNGDFKQAKELVQIASYAGVDAIKFQTFNSEMVVTKTALKANYQKRKEGSVETQFEMLRKLELSLEEHKKLLDFCRQSGTEFLSSPFDLTAIELLSTIGLNIWKVPSGEITNLPYLRKIGSLGQTVILSTGMADLGEIEDAIDVLDSAGTSRDKIILLHCNTEYPTPMCDVNLRALSTIQSAFPKIRIGYSDHTEGIEAPIAAVAMGAIVIEKHFTLDKSLPGPDHKASLEPCELEAMVKAIRNIEQAMGSGIKKASPSEKQNIPIVRKSIVALTEIHTGEPFSAHNLTCKRPGTGISPMRWDEIIGKKASRSFKKDDLIDA